MMEDYKTAKCCACEQLMTTSQHINMVALDYSPTWAFPRVGNILTNAPERACAVVCDKCIRHAQAGNAMNLQVKFAIERIDDREFKYHPVETLTPLPPSV